MSTQRAPDAAKVSTAAGPSRMTDGGTGVPRLAGHEGADVIAWPPSVEDLEAIEIVEVSEGPGGTGLAVGTPASLVPPRAPSPVALPVVTPGTLPSDRPRAPTVQATPIADVAVVREPPSPALDPPAATRSPGAAPKVARPVDWPPPGWEIDAVEVVDLASTGRSFPVTAGTHPRVSTGRGPAPPGTGASRETVADGWTTDQQTRARGLDPRTPTALTQSASETGTGVLSDTGEEGRPGVEERHGTGIRRWRVAAAAALLVLAASTGWLASGRPGLAPLLSSLTSLVRQGDATAADPVAGAGTWRVGDKSPPPGTERGGEPHRGSAASDARPEEGGSTIGGGAATGSTGVANARGGLAAGSSGDVMAARVLAEARAGADRARLAALGRLGRAAGEEVLAGGDAQRAAALEAWRAGEYDRALQGFLAAQRSYTRIAVGMVGGPPAPALAREVTPTATASAPAGERQGGSAASEAVSVPTSAARATEPATIVATGSAESPSSRPALGETTAPPVSVPSPESATTPTPAREADGRDALPVSAREPVAGAGARPAVATDAAVRQVLRAYQSAYDSLDAAAAAAVYPAVDARALARAFSGLRSQKLDFERCDVTSVSDDRAQASCVGRVAFVPRVGNQVPRVEARRWRFELVRAADGWRILRAQVGER